MTIHYSAILRPYADEMLHGSCTDGDMCRDCRDRAWLAWDKKESKLLQMSLARESEDALDHARAHDTNIDALRITPDLDYALDADPPDMHQETIDFAYCAR